MSLLFFAGDFAFFLDEDLVVPAIFISIAFKTPCEHLNRRFVRVEETEGGELPSSLMAAMPSMIFCERIR